MLRQASNAPVGQQFSCQVFGSSWDGFVELWAPRIHSFVAEALGPYAINPLPTILPVSDAFHAAGANASFASNGQICLGTHMDSDPGVTLEKLTHEMLHASLAAFPEGDPFYEEGIVDYSTWILAQAPYWEPYREDMIKAAADNIRNRRKRAFSTRTDYDRKRWTGGLYASMAYGPHIIATFRQRKIEGNFTW